MGNLDEEDEKKNLIKKLTDGLPTDYASRYKELTKISHLFHQEIGRALEPVLAKDAEQLQTMELPRRREWVSDRNHDLRKLHLAIKCQKTNRPALLIADSKGSSPEYLRYRLQIYEAGHAVRTYTGRSLPPLEIIEDDSRVENLAHRGRDIGRSGSSR